MLRDHANVVLGLPNQLAQQQGTLATHKAFDFQCSVRGLHTLFTQLGALLLSVAPTSKVAHIAIVTQKIVCISSTMSLG